MKRFLILPILALMLFLRPGLCPAAVTLAWDEPADSPPDGYYLYQSTSGPSAVTETYTVSSQIEHEVITSPYSIYMDDNYVDGGVVYAGTQTPLLRETTPALGVSDDAPENVASMEFYYHIAGVQYFKDAVSAGTVPGDDVIPQGKYGAVALDIGADGTIDVIEATDNATGYASAALAIAGLPAAAADHVRLGTLTVTKSDGAFTFGTTAFTATGVTTAFSSTPITLDAGEYNLFWFDNRHLYIFNAADAGEGVEITYTYTPLVKSYETYIVPASLTVALAHKPTANGTARHNRIRRTGESAPLTTAGISTDGLCTFAAEDVGQSVDIAYVYAKAPETVTVPVTVPSTVERECVQHYFVSDNYVYDTTNSVYFSKVPRDPGPGEYALSRETGNGIYLFNAADAGKALNINFDRIDIASFSKKLTIPGRKTSCTVRNSAAGTYYWVMFSYRGGTMSPASNVVSAAVDADACCSNLRIDSSMTIQKRNSEPVEVGY